MSTNTTLTPTVPSSGPVAFSAIKAAFNNVLGSKLSGYRGVSSSLPSSGAANYGTFTSFRGVTAPTPSTNALTNLAVPVSGTLSVLNAGGAVTGVAGAAAMTVNVSAYDDFPAYDGTCTYSVVSGAASGVSGVSGVSLSSAGVLTISSPTAGSGTVTIRLTNEYGNYRQIPISYTFLASPPTTANIVAMYTGESFSPGTNVWADVTGNGNHAAVSGAATVHAAGINGLAYVSGTTSTNVTFPSAVLPATYTLFHVVAYSDTTNCGRILSTNNSNNWLSGFWGGHSGVAFHNGWLTQFSSDWTAAMGGGGGGNGTSWLLSTDQNNLYRANGVTLGTSGAGSTSYASPLAINLFGDKQELSDWSVAFVAVFSGSLSASTCAAFEAWVAGQYGIALASSALASLRLTTANATATVALSEADCTSYAVVFNPKNNATVSGTTLTIVGTLSAAVSYTVMVEGIAADGSVTFVPVSVSETLQAPSVTSGTLALWLNAADPTGISTSSGKVTAWADQSVNFNVFDQGTSERQPTLVSCVLNSLPGVYFDGGQYLSTSTYSEANFGSTNTIFFVISGFSGGLLFYKGNSSYTWAQYDKKIWLGDGSTDEAGTGSYLSFAGNSCDYSTASLAASSAGTVVCMRTTSANAIQFFYDGISIANNNHGLSLSGDPGNVMSIGGPTTPNSDYLTGYVHEVLQYDAALTTEDVATVNAYLMSKWDISGTPPSITGTPATQSLTAGVSTFNLTFANATSVSVSSTGGSVYFNGNSATTSLSSNPTSATLYVSASYRNTSYTVTITAVGAFTTTSTFTVNEYVAAPTFSTSAPPTQNLTTGVSTFPMSFANASTAVVSGYSSTYVYFGTPNTTLVSGNPTSATVSVSASNKNTSYTVTVTLTNTSATTLASPMATQFFTVNEAPSPPSYSTAIPSSTYTNLTNGTTDIALSSYFSASDTLSWTLAQNPRGTSSIGGGVLSIAANFYGGSYSIVVNAYNTSSYGTSTATQVTLSVSEVSSSAVAQQSAASYVVAANGGSPWGGSMAVDASASYVWNVPNAAVSAPRQAGDSIYFTRAYTNSTNSNISATLYGNCDSGATAYLNGEELASADYFAGSGGNGQSVSISLVPGLNVVKFFAYNGEFSGESFANPAGLQFTVIDVSGADSAVLFHSDANTLTTVTAPVWFSTPSLSVGNNTSAVAVTLTDYCPNADSFSLNSVSSGGNAGISGTTLTYTPNYLNTTVSIVVNAANRGGATASSTFTVAEYPPAPSWTAVGNRTYTTGSKTISLSCSDYTSISVSSNPQGNATVSGATLTVVAACRGATYTVQLLATYYNGSTGLSSAAYTSFNVTELANYISGVNTTNLVAAYTGESYVASTGAWLDLSGSGLDAMVSGGTVTVTTNASDFGSRTYVSGTPSTVVSFPSVMNSTYTVLHLTKYNNGTCRRILAGASGNWLSGFWNGCTGVAYHEGWITNSQDWAGVVTNGGITAYGNNNWLMSTDANSAYRANGVGLGGGGGGGGSASDPIGVNNNPFGETSDWSIACLLVYNTNIIYSSQETWLASTYGIAYNTAGSITIPQLVPATPSQTYNVSTVCANCASYSVATSPSGFSASASGTTLTVTGDMASPASGTVIVKATARNGSYTLIAFAVGQSP